MLQCNTTLQDQWVNELPYHGTFNFHKLGLIISALFALFASSVAAYLMISHALHYSRPEEQKHIVRILFMIPVYSLVSFLSYYFYRHAIYFEVIRDCYEAFVIASFFTLLCTYIAGNLHDQKDYFRSVRPRNWIWPLPWIQRCTGGQEKGILKRPTSGLTWFNMIWIGIFQYCFIRVFFTFISLVTEATGRYCENSLNPVFAHIWVEIFEGLSVTLAMYCIFQFYFQIKDEIREHRPFMKLLCIKLVIFFSFWQTFLISFASTKFKPTEHISYQDVKVGVPSMLLCIEMAIFSILHIFAFPWRSTYSLSRTDAMNAPGLGFSGKPKYKGGFLGLRAYADAFNVWDVIKASSRGFRWLFVGRKYRRQDSSYANPFVDPPGYSYREASNGAYEGTKLQPIGTAQSNFSKENARSAAGRYPDFGASTGDLGTLQPSTAYKPEQKYPISSFDPSYDMMPSPSAVSSRGPSPARPSEKGQEDRRWYSHGAPGYEEDQAGLLSGAPTGSGRPSEPRHGPQHPAVGREPL